jgi:hypothetical protein
MKIGLLLIGALVLVGAYFLLPNLTASMAAQTKTYVTYGAYGLGGILVLAGLFGKKKFY